jgi:hypothetical protein
LTVGIGRIGIGVTRIIAVVAMVIIVVIGQRVSDRCAADAAHHCADRTAHDSPADGASDPSGHRAALVSQSGPA